MTAQINDKFRYSNREYAVAGISEEDVFDPALLGLEPAKASTACWRGYQAVYSLAGSRLLLDTLHVNLLKRGGGYQREEGPLINGVKPRGGRSGHDLFNNHYERLNHPLEYTGGLLLADGFIRDLYVHMGFHPPWKYERVMELIFDAGTLKYEFDRSEQMAEIRQRFLELEALDDSNRIPAEDEIVAFVKRAFDRSYDL